MNGSRGARVLRAALLGFLLPVAAFAEIKHEIRGEEIVATNLKSGRLKPSGNPDRAKLARVAPPMGATSSVPGEAPAPPGTLSELLDGSAVRYGFDPTFIRSVVAAESAFNHRAVSPKGARGLMQLMPETARRYGVRDVHDPASNLNGGVAYLRDLVGRFRGDVTLALAAYNAGPEAVARYGGVPPYEETQAYIARIRAYYGEDLQSCDRNGSPYSIRLVNVEDGGVPHFTNIRPRRPAGRDGKPGRRP